MVSNCFTTVFNARDSTQYDVDYEQPMWLQQLIYQLKRPYHWWKTGIMEGLVAEIRYRWPARKLRVIAFTGTDGKTTTSTMMYQVLKTAGYQVALLSTVAAFAGDEELDTGFHVTTPSPALLHKFMRKLVDQGYEYLVLETTSHGIYQYRTWGIKPFIAGVTNINFEHLDYHLSYDNYVEAKALLLKAAKYVVLNADDMSFPKLKKILHARSEDIWTYSQSSRVPKLVKQAIADRFPEAFNQMNARLVATIAQGLRISPQLVAAGITAFEGVTGRLQKLPNDRGIEIVIDFAHTPQGVEAALTALRHKVKQKNKKARLIVVHGSAGLRDRNKRPAMGRISSSLADLVVFTAEDPRTEDVWSIIRQMKEEVGLYQARVISIADRQEAISYAINNLAKKGDLVALLGKGHEKSMAYGHTEYPWSEVAAVQFALQQSAQPALARK